MDATLVLLVHVPLGPVQQRELTCKVVDAFRVAVGKAQDTVRLHQRNGGENIVSNVAAAVHDDIGCDLTQAVQQLYHLLLRKGRGAVLVLPFEQPQYRKAAVALKGDKVMLDKVLADTAAARTPAREPLLSRASAGQMHGSMGAAMSQSRRMPFFFLAESIFAIFTAVTVFPLPGLPQTASIPPLSFCSSGFSVSR